MVDFAAMAKLARAKSDEILEAADAAQQAKQEAEDRRLATAEEFLRNKVLPVLNSAADDFKKQGVSLQLKEYDNFRIVNARHGDVLKTKAISFQCFLDKENASKTYRVISGDKFVVEHDGDALYVKKDDSASVGKKFPGGTIPDFVAPTLVQALDSLYNNDRAKY